uniref:B30.2/SPRY domain-containing protein n=2 Tax=Esox lucius TaxID=8010 RepID=A0A6Q2WZ00_ESOLU
MFNLCRLLDFESTASKMSHSGDREEGTTASKRSLLEGTAASKRSLLEGTTASKRKRRRVHQERPDSPVPSCQSEKDEHTMGRPIDFREGDLSSEQGVRPERPDSLVPCCVSMKSGHSMGLPEYFRKGEQGVHQERSDSPVPSCVPMKSNHTMERPVSFGEGDLSSHQGRVQHEKSTQMKFQTVLRPHQDIKTKLGLKYQHLSEGHQGKRTLVKDIYTDLYITEGGSGWINEEHEVRQIEMAFKRENTQETTIKSNDIFKPVSQQQWDNTKLRGLRNLTKGIAGIGKTVTVQKVILDWAEGEANQDIDFMFPLPFRDLNLIKGQYSLMQLLSLYFPELKEIDSIEDDETKTVFILDGLDEYRLHLDFKNNQKCYDVTESNSVDVLLTNLIEGNMFPSALLWITTRPAAANQIPPECVDQVTEIRGFNEAQKDEYLRKKITNPNLANNIIKHIKSSRTLHIMCHIPVFCWISATVLEMMLKQEEKDEIPNTLIQMYSQFILIQTSVKNKYNKATETNPKEPSQTDKEMILKLSKLAFQQLQKGNLIFYEEDLRECGIDVTEASGYSALCTEIFIEECGLYHKKVFSFVHLSLQEFLAAVHALESCLGKEEHVFPPKAVTQSPFHCDDVEDNDDGDDVEVRKPDKLYDLYRRAVDQALISKNGHLDLFLRFLMGLSLKSNQDLLKGLLTQAGSTTQQNMETLKRTEKYLSDKIKKESSPERTINLFHCLNELGANSLVENMQITLRSGILSEAKLQPHQCSALTYLLLMSEDVLEEFDLKRYNRSAEGYQRFLPVVKNCKRALLSSCNLNYESCKTLGLALQTSKCLLKELDISYNHLEDRGVELLCAGLTSPICKIQTLVLARCKLTSKSCETLISALRTPNCLLRDLILSYNHLEDRGVKLLCAGPATPIFNIRTLDLGHCGLTEGCCLYLASVLRSPNSQIKKLELRDNDLKDAGVTQLSTGMEDPNCKLHALGLSGCLVTEEGCASLASALRSNPFNLRELDLSYNYPGDSGVKLLSAGLDNLQWRPEKLSMDHCENDRLKSGPRKYACDLTLDLNTAYTHLSVSEENRNVTFSELQPYPVHTERFDYWNQVLCSEGLTGRCYWEVERNGEVVIAVTYKGISRKGKDDDSRLGYNDKSWSLDFYDNRCFAYHHSKKTSIPDPASSPWPNRVGVYLDWPAGTLSFYSISSDTLSHIHTFHCTFTEPLYPGFWVGSDSSVSLCQVK